MTIGTKLGRLTLIALCDPPKFLRRPEPHGLFKCDCGRTKNIRLYSVTSGRTRSCGCRAQVAVRGAIAAWRAEMEAKAK